MFDLDHTLLDGDIGDHVFRLLDEQRLLRRIPIMRGISGKGESLSAMARYGNHETSWDLYQRALREADTAGDEGAVADIYAWMTVSMAGLTPSQIREATREGWTRSGLRTRSETVALAGELLTSGFDLWIVSATNLWSVRWVVEHKINPLLQEETGLSIPLSHVEGMTTELSGSESSSESRLTEVLKIPCPTFKGKAALLQERLAAPPFLVCGDSPNDGAMLRLAQCRVVVPRAVHNVWAQNLEHESVQQGKLFFLVSPS